MPIPTKKHPVTGCRVDTIMGIWLMPAEPLEKLVNMGWGIVENGQLEMYSDRSQKMREEANERPRYVVQNGIARFEMSGPLTKMPTSMGSLFGGFATMDGRETLREIRAEAAKGTIKGVFIDADSAGGTAEGMDEFAAAVRKTDAVVPVAFHAADKAMSAMLWAATQGSRFTCGRTAQVGSQGTRMELSDRSEEGKEGKTKPIIIDTGTFKSVGEPGRPITDEQKAYVQGMINAINEPFKQDVITSRKLTADQAAEVASAKIFIGDDAKRVGLVDAVCTADEAFFQFHDMISTGALNRGPVPVPTQAAQGTRRTTMLNATQLAEARKLPGMTGLTEENADVLLLGLVTAQQSTITDLQQKVVAPMAPTLADGHVKLAVKELDMLGKENKLLPEQLAVLKAAMIDDKGSPVMSAVAPDGTIMLSADTVFKAIELNKPNGLGTTLTGGQPAPKQEPGNDAGKVDKPTLARLNEVRQHAGLAPLSQAAYEATVGA